MLAHRPRNLEAVPRRCLAPGRFKEFCVIKFLWKRVSEAPVGQGGLIGAPLATTSSVSQKAPVAYPTIAQRNLIQLVRWHCLTNLEAVAWHLSRRRASGAQATG
jgi:hypothetical protein